MKNANVVKFSFVVPKSEVKNIVISSLDFDVNVTYPQLKNAPSLVKIKGVCSIDCFESFLDNVSSKVESYFDRIAFIQGVKFKLIEIDVNPIEIIKE